eukprot:g28585.t1
MLTVSTQELEAAKMYGPEAAAEIAEEVCAMQGMPPGVIRSLLPEPVTKAEAVLMTPPSSPGGRVRAVASPCRGGRSPKISASARAVQRLKSTMNSPEADGQSDVSDWESGRSVGGWKDSKRLKAEEVEYQEHPRALPLAAYATLAPCDGRILVTVNSRQDEPEESTSSRCPSRVQAQDSSPEGSVKSRAARDFSSEACLLPLPSTPTGRSMPDRGWETVDVGAWLFLSDVGSLLYWSMLAACTVGPGTVVTCARSGVEYQLHLVWALCFASILAYTLQEGSARLTLVSGKTLGQCLQEKNGKTESTPELFLCVTFFL